MNIGDVSGLVSPMEGSVELTPERASFLLDGQLYINIHTAANTDGEIRGQASCEPSPPLPEESVTATLIIGGNEFDIQYMISGGTLDELNADPAVRTLLLSISSTSDGTLTVWLPRDVIDADDEFSVLVDGESGNFIELDPTTDARVLQIEFENGAREIEMIGTFIVPEFGAIGMLVMGIAIVGAIVATTRFHKFGGLQT